MFLSQDQSFDEQFRAFGRSVAAMLRGASRRQLLLDRAWQVYLLSHPAAKARQREVMRGIAATGGAWLEAMAEHQGVQLPMPGPSMIYVVTGLMRGLIEAALQDRGLLDDSFFEDAFELLAPRGQAR